MYYYLYDGNQPLASSVEPRINQDRYKEISEEEYNNLIEELMELDKTEE